MPFFSKSATYNTTYSQWVELGFIYNQYLTKSIIELLKKSQSKKELFLDQFTYSTNSRIFFFFFLTYVTRKINMIVTKQQYTNNSNNNILNRIKKIFLPSQLYAMQNK